MECFAPDVVRLEQEDAPDAEIGSESFEIEAVFRICMASLSPRAPGM